VLYNWVSGGLNHQIEHHLFPSMSIHLYPLISPIVQKTCHDFDLPYYNYQSFFTAYTDMIKYLKAMGNPSFQPHLFTSQLQAQIDDLARARQRSAGRGQGVKVGTKAKQG